MIRLTDNNLQINGRNVFLRGGELEYFRLPAEKWTLFLKTARDLGANVVGSYMPWFAHEYEEGRFDFTGAVKPENDLAGFIRRAADLGLWVIARPGPFLNSELRYGGLPHWLCENHPEILSRRVDGNIAPGRPCPAEGESAYRNYVRKWYRAVDEVLAPFSDPDQGPVILFQPDNEVSAAWSFGLFNSLYDPETLANRWPTYLQAAYQTIERFNALHALHEDARYASFRDVPPPREFGTDGKSRRLIFDFLDFKRDLFCNWSLDLAEYAMADGIRVPFVVNEPVAGFFGRGDHSGFGAVARKRPSVAAFNACHTYSAPLMDLDGVTALKIAIELAKTSELPGPAISVEANVHWYAARLNRNDLNWDILYRLGLGHGLNGVLLYPLAEHRSDFANSIDGPEYFHPGLIGFDGKATHAGRIAADFHQFAADWEPLICAAAVRPEIAIAITPGMRYADFAGVPPLAETGRTATARRGAAAAGAFGHAFAEIEVKGGGAFGHDWTDGYEGVSKQTARPEAGAWQKVGSMSTLATALNIAWEFRDLTATTRAPGQGLIVVPNTGCLERSAADYLIRHMRAGGHCLFTPCVPCREPDGTFHGELADFLGCDPNPELIRPPGGVPLDYGCRVVDSGISDPFGVHTWLYSYALRDGVALAAHKGKPLAAGKPVGAGRAWVAGFDPAYTSLASLRFWSRFLFDECGVVPAVRVEDHLYHGVLRQGPGGGILAVANHTGRYGDAEMRVAGLPPFRIGLAPFEARLLPVNAPFRDNVIAYANCEIVKDGTGLRVRGPAGARGMIAFAKPCRILLNGDAPLSAERDGRHVFEFELRKDNRLSLSPL